MATLLILGLDIINLPSPRYRDNNPPGTGWLSLTTPRHPRSGFRRLSSVFLAARWLRRSSRRPERQWTRRTRTRPRRARSRRGLVIVREPVDSLERLLRHRDADYARTATPATRDSTDRYARPRHRVTVNTPHHDRGTPAFRGTPSRFEIGECCRDEVEESSNPSVGFLGRCERESPISSILRGCAVVHAPGGRDGLYSTRSTRGEPRRSCIGFESPPSDSGRASETAWIVTLLNGVAAPDRLPGLSPGWLVG